MSELTVERLRHLAHEGALRPCGPYQLAGIGKGRVVNVVGSGPSAVNCKPADGEITIVCNGAIKHVKADVWVCGEAESWKKDWFLGNQDFEGHVCWERFNTEAEGAEALLAAYSPAFLERVLWFHRVQFHPLDDPLLFDKGLYCVRSDMLGDEAGTTALHAIHLALMMGAEEIRVYGCELHFPEGKQYAWDENAYTKGDGMTSLVGFDLTPDGEPFILASGKFQSTRVFIESARVIRKFLSCFPKQKFILEPGLLCPEKMLDAKEVERKTDRGSNAKGIGAEPN